MMYENSTGSRVIQLSGVPTSALDSIGPKLLELLEKIAKEGLDMDRLATVLHRFDVKVRCVFFFFATGISLSPAAL